MAGPRPSDNYNPTPNVAPETGMPSDYLSVRANPSETGGLVAEQLQKAGQTGEQLGNQAYALAIERQGQINETLANNADSQYFKAAGDIYNKYKNLEGLDAVAAKDKAVADIQATRQQIRASLPSDAVRRAFDQTSIRREGYMVFDMEGYADSQIKKANTDSATASMVNAVNSSGMPSIATNSFEFGRQLGTIQHNAMIVMQNQGYGSLMHYNEQTGQVTFDNTADGNKAKEYYTSFLDKYVGEAYKNKILTLAYDPKIGNVKNAVDELQRDKDSMPAAAYTEIAARLSQPYKTYQTKSTVDNIWSQMDTDYVSSQGQAATGKVSPISLTQAVLGQESRNNPNAPTSISGAVGIGQIEPGTWKQFAHSQEDINNPKDNAAVAQRILTHYLDEYKGDPERAMVAYYSGEGNVSPLGSPTPWVTDIQPKTGPSVSGYVSQVMQRLEGQGNITGFQSKADWLRSNYYKYASQVSDQLSNQFPDHPELVDQGNQQFTTKMDREIRAQALQDKVYYDNTLNYIFKNHVTSETELENSPVKDDWNNLNFVNAIAASGILTHIMPAIARADNMSYGSNFYKLYEDALSGKLTDSSTLVSSVSGEKNATLSPMGFQEIYNSINNTKTAQDRAFNQQESDFLKKAFTVFTGSALSGGHEIPQGVARAEAWIKTIIPQIQQLRSEGKGSEIFNDKSSDYIGKSIIAPSTHEVSQSVLSSVLMGNQANNQPINYSSLKDTVAAVKAGKITYEQGVAYANSKGWIAKEGPKPVAPEVPVPK